MWPLTYDRIGRITPNSVLQLRPLSSITLEDAISILKVFGRFYEGNNYLIRYRKNTYGEKFAQLYYVYDGKDQIAVNFGDDGTFHAVNSNRGETYLFAHITADQLGYAQPVYFKGVQYSVDRLVELGIYNIVA